METGEVPRLTIAEIYDITASKFGIKAEQLFGKAKNSSDPLNTARNVAAMVALVAGHDRFQISYFSQRSETVIHGLAHKAYEQPKRARLAWGIWKEVGGSWDAFERTLRLLPPTPAGLEDAHIEILEMPKDDEYVIPGISRSGAGDEAVPILKYFTRNMDISPDLLRHLGLGVRYQGEKQLYTNLLKTATTDYLLGEDAKAWILVEEQSNDDGISFSDACTMLSIEPEALRRKLLRIAELVQTTRERKPEND